MAVRLRARRPTDDDFIAKLSRAAFSEYNPDAGTRLRLDAPDTRVRVAILNEKAIGFTNLRLTPPTAHLDAIAVSESARGRGIGSALLGAAERDARRAGASVLRLATADSNLAALDLFLKRGYRIVRTERRFYPRGQTAHVLEKTLSIAD